MNKSFGRNKEYEQHLDGKLPAELEQFRHSIEWPIDTNTQEFHLAHYFCENKLGKARCNHGVIDMNIEPHLHSGIDIHMPAGTIVYAPENGRIIALRQDKARNLCLADLTMYSPDSGIEYVLAHVHFCDMPEKIRKCKPFDKDSGITVEKGEEIAKVGYWPFGTKTYQFIPEEIKAKGGDYCHLHLGTGFYPDVSQISQYNYTRFNPLLILKKLAL